MPPPVTTVLFDADGTLVDSNYLHVWAWYDAFADAGFHVPCVEIHKHVGMGSTQFMEALIGEARDDVKARWRATYDRLKPRQRALPGARELLEELVRRGVTVGLATSAPAEDVEALVEAVGSDELFSFTTSAGDVEEAKPSPAIFESALRTAGCRAEEAMVVGDTVWDVLAATEAGVPCVAVLTGGIARAELQDAGALAVYEDLAELRAQLDASPLGAAVG